MFLKSFIFIWRKRFIEKKEMESECEKYSHKNFLLVNQLDCHYPERKNFSGFNKFGLGWESWGSPWNGKKKLVKTFLAQTAAGSAPILRFLLNHDWFRFENIGVQKNVIRRENVRHKSWNKFYFNGRWQIIEEFSSNYIFYGSKNRFLFELTFVSAFRIK